MFALLSGPPGRHLAAAALLVSGGACAGDAAGPARPAPAPLPVFDLPAEPPDPTAATPPPPILITDAVIMTAAGAIFPRGYLLLENGRIAAVGDGDAPSPPAGTEVIAAAGHWVTPGIIDTHSHMGVYPLPYVSAHSDGNEMVAPTTAEVWAEHGFWPQDPSLWRAVAGGVTTVQVLPGSANLIGGRTFVAKLKPAISARLMRFPGAPQGLKMACGENPKRVYGERGGPHTRMGNVAGYRAAFQRAREYRRAWQIYQRDLDHWRAVDGKDEEEQPVDPPAPPPRDFGLETLVKVLDGTMAVHNHCYRADEMHIMLDLAEEFGFTIRSFHHALEAYKLADRLAASGVASSTWADWWGFKMEAFDGVPQNAALLTAAGARAVIHSDSAADLRHLNQEAAKARVAGRKVGIEISEDQALRWITANAAWVLGVADQTGSLEVGKMADVVIWDGHPFSVYSHPSRVFIDGVLSFAAGAPPRRSDFELGLGVETPPEPLPGRAAP